MNERDVNNGSSHQQPDRSPNRPIDTLRDGALKTAIFRNQNEHGESYAVVPSRIYTDKQTDKVRETHSLAGAEILRMAHLLTKAHDRIGQLREQSKEQSKGQSREDRPAPRRDTGRER